jgi:hypothetical protein
MNEEPVDLFTIPFQIYDAFLLVSPGGGAHGVPCGHGVTAMMCLSRRKIGVSSFGAPGIVLTSFCARCQFILNG